MLYALNLKHINEVNYEKMDWFASSSNYSGMVDGR